MRILLIEDHNLVRTGLKHLLGRSFENVEIHEADSAAAAMASLPLGRWDLVLLDLDLPDRSGFDLIRDIQALSPGARILVVTGEAVAEAAARTFKAGADGFISKTAANAELVRALQRLLEGKKYMSPDVATQLVDTLTAVGPAHESLSDRELEVLKQFGRGLTASEISHNLGLSVKTVSTYRSRILEKLNLETTGELVRYAVKHDLC